MERSRRHEAVSAAARSAVGNGARRKTSRAAGPVSSSSNSVKALTFDVFGTVVDWRSSIVREGLLLSAAKGLQVDWEGLADAWRAGYQPAMQQVRTGAVPWTILDDLHRRILESLVKPFALDSLSAAELDRFNSVWHRLSPWPDSVSGLNRLKTRYILATLSNGNVSLLVEMAKNAGLPWDCILSAELAHRYKPDPEAYLTAVRLLGLEAHQVMMVAAHPDDLRAASGVGLRTAFVPRPLEYGPSQRGEALGDFKPDVIAPDFNDLASQLGT